MLNYKYLNTNILQQGNFKNIYLIYLLPVLYTGPTPEKYIYYQCIIQVRPRKHDS